MAEARLTISMDETLRLHLEDALRREAELRAELDELRVMAGEVRRYWRDWPQQRRDAVSDLSRFLAGAIENLSASLSRWNEEHPEGGGS